MLKIKNVTKGFKHKEILSNVNLSLKEGELIHIKGINGSGKSTLLKIIGGLMLPDNGEVIISKGVKIGALIENPGFIENESLAYNLKFLFTLTNTYEEEKVRALVEMFQLEYTSKVPMKNYSVGMRQKAGIIQAIMENQNLILFDEPTRGLDNDAIITFTTCINELLKEGKSIIICAHDGVEGLPFTREYELKNGKLL